MSYVEMTDIAGGARELTDTELAIVAGGGPVADLFKIGAGLIGGLIGGAPFAALAAATAVLINAAGKDVGPNTLLNSTAIEERCDSPPKLESDAL
jgi:hypothetical protein